MRLYETITARRMFHAPATFRMEWWMDPRKDGQDTFRVEAGGEETSVWVFGFVKDGPGSLEDVATSHHFPDDSLWRC